MYDDHGQLLSGTLMDYVVPSACEVPWMEVHHLETPSLLTLGGFRRIGEEGTIGAPAALANAIADALVPLGIGGRRAADDPRPALPAHRARPGANGMMRAPGFPEGRKLASERVGTLPPSRRRHEDLPALRPICRGFGGSRPFPDRGIGIARAMSVKLEADEVFGERTPATGQDDLNGVLERILTKARRFTRAEAGTIYLREGPVLRFAAVQNDALARQIGEQELRRRFGAEPLKLSQESLAGYVSLTGRALNIQDAYRIPLGRPYRFDRAFDERLDYRTLSLFLVPILDRMKVVLGVLQLINALDARGRPAPFQPPYTYVQRTLASDAALAIGDATVEGRAPTVAPRGNSSPHNGNGSNGAPDVPVASPIGRRLGELLVAQHRISHGDLDKALAEQSRTREKLGAILVRMRLLSEDELVEFLARHYGVRSIAVPEAVDPELLGLVPAAISKKHELIPVERNGNSLIVAMSDPTNLAAIDDVAFLTGLRVAPCIAAPSVIRRAIERWYRLPVGKLDDVLSEAEDVLPILEIIDANEVEAAPDPGELRASSDQEPVVRVVNMLLLDAIRRKVSDIHLEPFHRSLRVRFRIDGILQQVMTPPRRLTAAITSRIKIMADLDISEHRRPQDGHIKLRTADREVDVRVATLPTVFGEGVILRILDHDVASFDPARLGFDAVGLDRLHTALRSRHGLVLVTGPTGSGKSTTLYAALQILNSLDVKIITIEDPVEYHLEGVSQVQVNEDADRTFASALRSFLRSDPDVIMVGEMRDSETIQTATRAALTGHLVLSTLHTNDSASTVARLLDMGVPPFLISASLRLVVAQRLVRMICSECREGYEATEESLVPHGHTPTGRGTLTLFKGLGCPRCNFTGLKGRVALYELMPVNQPLREMIAKAPSVEEIRAVARGQGMVPLRQAGLLKVVEGITTVDEVLRVTSDLS